MSELPTYASTPVADIAGVHARLVETWESGRTIPLEYRKIALRKLYHAIKDNTENIVAALKADLNKPEKESLMIEVCWLEKDILDTLAQLDKWAKDEKAPTSIIYAGLKPRMKKGPMGTVLIIGAFNYPFQLTVVPLIGAIAAGCPAIVKPSEMCPVSAALLAHIIGQALEPDAYTVVNGGIPETTEVLAQKFDKIMYTGNGQVARIVSAAAAKNLTPVILELGGLNPVFITSKADAKLAGKRIGWGKVHNAGQICISPDYVMVDPSMEEAFVQSFTDAINEFYPNGTDDKENFGRIVNDRHFKRITGLLEKSKGEVKFGGKSDAAERWIEPTLVKIGGLDDALLSEEIFGPVLPYMIVEGGVQEMSSIVRKVGDCPLGLYAFTNDAKEQEYIVNTTRSGGISFNDTMFHAAIQSIPFGGIGESGTGCYRGKASFDAFTHLRPIIDQPGWMEGQLDVRYPPYTDAKYKKYRMTQFLPAVDFDSNGKIVTGMWYYWRRLVLLGAGTKRGGVVRHLLAALIGLCFWKWGKK